MLSTAYRLRLEGICKSIAAGQEVSLEDMIWAEKLSRANTSARGMLSSARRLSTDEDGTCLKYLDIGDPRKSKNFKHEPSSSVFNLLAELSIPLADVFALDNFSAQIISSKLTS